MIYRPSHTSQRIKILQECLLRYEVPEERKNVKAAMKAIEDGVINDETDTWTVFYNGKIVDRMNSQQELLWSVRYPLYQELFGNEGSIWIEPVSYPELPLR